MRELIYSFKKQVEVVALVDPDQSRGGLTQDEVQERLIAAEGSYMKWSFGADTPSGQSLYEHLSCDEPIEWNRLVRAAPPS